MPERWRGPDRVGCQCGRYAEGCLFAICSGCARNLAVMLNQRIAIWLASKPRWPWEVGAVLTSAFLFRDVTSMIKENPSWAGPINLLPTLVLIAFMLCIVGLCLVHWGQQSTKESYKDLQLRAQRAQDLEDVIAENITEIVNGIIAGFIGKLNLRAEDNSRISIYIDDGLGGLVNIGRVATNPNFSEVGRKILPKDEGCVGRAWAEGWVFEADFGDDGYENHQSHYGMPLAVINGLKMKPKYLAAMRVDDDIRSLAVIVFESMQPKKFDEIRVRKEMRVFSSYIVGPLRAFKPHLPRPLGGIGGGI